MSSEATAEKIETRWRRWYGSLPPSHYTLLEEAEDRWVRAWSLSGGAWLRDTQREQVIVASRLFALGHRLIGDGSSAFMLYSEDTAAVPAWRKSVFAEVAKRSLDLPRLTYERTYWSFSECPIEQRQDRMLWNNFAPVGRYDVVGEKIEFSSPWCQRYVEWCVRHGIWWSQMDHLIFCPESGMVMCPYGEGIDLFFPTREAASRYRRRLRSWSPGVMIQAAGEDRSHL